MAERCCGIDACPCCGADVPVQGGRPTLCRMCAVDVMAMKAPPQAKTAASAEDSARADEAFA
jgi:hypothetical protein